MTKRIIALLLSLCMLASSISVVANTAPVVSLSSMATYPGEYAVLELDLNDCNGFVNLGLEVIYDNSVMKLVAVNTNSDVGATCTTAQTLSTNPYNIGWDATENVYYNGNLATFEFLVYDSVSAGEYPVYVDYYKGRNGNLSVSAFVLCCFIF